MLYMDGMGSNPFKVFLVTNPRFADQIRSHNSTEIVGGISRSPEAAFGALFVASPLLSAVFHRGFLWPF